MSFVNNLGSVVKKQSLMGNLNNHKSGTKAMQDLHSNQIILQGLKSQQEDELGFCSMQIQKSDEKEDLLLYNIGQIGQIKQGIFNVTHHTISLRDLECKLNTSLSRGLDQSSAEKRLNYFGLNQYTPHVIPFHRRLLKEWLKLPFPLVWFCGIANFVMSMINEQETSDSLLFLGVGQIAIIIVSSIWNVELKISQEKQANQMEETIFLRDCLVLRDNTTKRVPVSTLVLGDIVIIKEGDMIPADLRIFQEQNMRVEKSVLTGEEQAFDVSVHEFDENVLESKNLLLRGSYCTGGQGKGIVVSTGDKTIFGQIFQRGVILEETEKSPLEKLVNRHIKLASIVNFVIILIIFAAFKMKQVETSMFVIIPLIGVHYICALPIGLRTSITLSLNKWLGKLHNNKEFVKRQSAVQTITSCICVEKSNILTEPTLIVKQICYGGKCYEAKNIRQLDEDEVQEYDINNPDFKSLEKAAILSSQAYFDTDILLSKNNNISNDSIIGDVSECAIVRFFQPIDDVREFRSKYCLARQPNGNPCHKPFYVSDKYVLVIIEEEREKSYFTLYMRGNSENVLGRCSSFLQDGEVKRMTQNYMNQLRTIIVKYNQLGQRVFAFAQLRLSSALYPKSFRFITTYSSDANFELAGLTFIGFMSMQEPPKNGVIEIISRWRAAGIKVIMLSNQFDRSCLEAARQLKILPDSYVSNLELMDENENLFQNQFNLMQPNGNLSWFQATEISEAIVVKGFDIDEAISLAIQENRDSQLYYLERFISKPVCIFARLSPRHRQLIISACQDKGYKVTYIGESKENYLALKKADVGIFMNTIPVQDKNKSTHPQNQTQNMELIQTLHTLSNENTDKPLISNKSQKYQPIQPQQNESLFNLKFRENLKNQDIMVDSADFILQSDQMSSVMNIIEASRVCYDTYIKFSLYMLQVQACSYFSILAYIFLDIPLPMTASLTLTTCFLMAFYFGISLNYDEPEIDITVRNPSEFSQQATTISSRSILFSSFFITGIICVSAGFIGYATILNRFGFPINCLIGLASLQGFKPPANDFGKHMNYFTNLMDEYVNLNLDSISHNCSDISDNNLRFRVDWFTNKDAQYDLRKTLLKCDPQSHNWVPQFTWSYCDVEQNNTYSSFTNSTACYSTEALRYAQTGFFVSIVFALLFSLMFSRTSKQPCFLSPFNNHITLTIFLSILSSVGIIYIPGMQAILGTRCLEFFELGIPSIPFYIFLLFYRELIRLIRRRSFWSIKFIH